MLDGIYRMVLKKFFPLILFVVAFTGFLAGQIAFDWIDINAEPSKEEKSVHAHYESLFKKSVFKDTEGKSYSLSKEKAPVVIVNFWASWCQPCLEEFPSIVAMKKKYSDDQVLVLGVNTDSDEPKKNIKKTVKKFGLNFPIVPDEDSKYSNDFLISAIPVSIIYHNGKVIEVSNEPKDFNSEEWNKMLATLIKKTN